MNDHWPQTEHVVPSWAGRARRIRAPGWTSEQKRRLKELWFVKPPIPADELAEQLETTPSNVYSWAHRLGLPRRSKRGSHFGRKRRRIVRKADPSGQRRFHGVKSDSEGPHVVLQPHDPRYRAGTTIFPTTVAPAASVARMLKSGHNSRKIGKTVAKGRLRGAPIFTLTLEERATCPRTCEVWATCYGNGMPFAHRIFDDGTLTKRLWGELASLSAENPNGFLVRLHVLGDFFSMEYVAFWRQALEDFPALNIFGFTARRPPDAIGSAIVELVRDHYERCRIRFSGLALQEDGAVVVDRKEDAIGILCPAEQDPDRCCATCALCWHTNRTISFMRH